MKTKISNLKVNVEKLHPNPWNPNKTTKRQQAAIDESLNLYGQVLPLVVRPHPELEGEFQIIDGEHRFNVKKGEVDINVIEGLTDADAKRLTIVLNETRGQADKIELATLLNELDKELGENLLIALPYDPGELDELIQLADYDWDSFSSEKPIDTDTEEASGSGQDDGKHHFSARLTDNQQDLIKQVQDMMEEELKGVENKNATMLELLCYGYLGLA